MPPQQRARQVLPLDYLDPVCAQNYVNLFLPRHDGTSRLVDNIPALIVTAEINLDTIVVDRRVDLDQAIAINRDISAESKVDHLRHFLMETRY
jgi:hypothetical protein